MSNEILLITNYFPPEKGAAANRMYSMAEGFGKAGYFVNVICPLPNYPNGEIFKNYTGKLIVTEKTVFGKISRIWIWPSNSTNKLVRLLSMVSFSISLTLFFIFKKTPQKIFIQYSPVFVGFTAVLLGRLFSKKIVLNVSDLWPLAGLEMGILQKGGYYSTLLKMERFCYRNAVLIIGQSKEILEHVSSIQKDKPVFLYQNIPNFPIPILIERKSSEEIKIVYAGLLGVAQGLYEICQQISLPANVSLHIYGSGPEAERIASLEKENVFYHGDLDREILHTALQQYDIAFIPLISRIFGSVPSKLFEYTRLGLPVLYFAGGEGGNIVIKESLGWVVPVNDFKMLQYFLNTISEKGLEQFSKELIQKNSIAAFDFERQFETFKKLVENI